MANSSSIHRMCAFLACTGFLGLAGCGDNLDPAVGPPDMPDMPDMPDCQPSGSMSNSGNPGIATIYVNSLGTNPIMFNALTSNPDVRQDLIKHKLHSETYDSEAHPRTAQPALVEQLADVWTRRLFSYMVTCALSPEQQVSWHSPITGMTETWRGERGFCPKWYEGGIEDDQTCQELVSACLLASNNAYERQVRISMRGVQDGEALPWQDLARGGLPKDFTSGRVCAGDEVGQGARRDCGWTVEHVGVCRQDAAVELAGETCEGDMMVRICEGHNACDAAESYTHSATVCEGGKASFSCPDKGEFTVMSAPASPKAPGELDLRATTGAVYPVAEDKLFSYREGAFYGNLFAPDSLDERLAVRVKDGRVVYSFAIDGADPIEQGIYDVGCDNLGDMTVLRRERHEAFVQQVSAMLRQNFVVHRKLFACWDPGWSEGAAYAAKRVCAGPSGKAFCAATPLNPCWDSLGSANNLCDTDDDPGTPGDRDYRSCRDDQDKDKRWEHPVTVFLDDPCAMVSNLGLCAVRKVKTVAAGSFHTCAALSDGNIRCWGQNVSGQLGYGHTMAIGDDEAAAAAGAVDVGGEEVEQIAASTSLTDSTSHTCAVLKGGVVRCWGDNSLGQLGLAIAEDVGDDETPAEVGVVDVGGTVKQIAVGGEHTCALLDSGAVRCWGKADGGLLGYGDGQLEPIGDDETPSSVGDVPLGGMATQIAAGIRHTCALLDSGAVVCWGDGADGALGYGNTDDIGDDETPASIGPISLGGTAVQITTGGYHTCARLDTKAVRCWGSGADGRLGYASLVNVGDQPGRLPSDLGDIDLGGPATQIAAGHNHTCAVLASGDVRCWGHGAFLGRDNPEHIGDNEVPGSVPPVQLGRPVGDLSGDPALPKLSASVWHTCAVVEPGNLRCWGSADADDGQLGYGKDEDVGADKIPAKAGDVPVF